MSFVDKLYDFFKVISAYFRNMLSEGNSRTLNESESLLVDKILEEESTDLEEEDSALGETSIGSWEEEKLNISKRTLITKLYVLKREIELFETDFPNEYNRYLNQIQSLEESYNSALEESKKTLTFEIDPEMNSNLLMKVSILEGDIRRFLDTEFKFHIISRKLQKLIVKLNILYNVSIFHSSQKEKAKVLSQLEHGLEAELDIAKEFKECDYLINDSRIKDRIVTLMSYIDYEILKTTLRNSNRNPNEVKLVLANEFYGFEFTDAFNTFMQEELSDLGEKINWIEQDEYRKVFQERLSKLLENITTSFNNKNLLTDSSFANEFLNLETTVFEHLRINGVEKSKIKVEIPVRMNISVSESDVLTLPKTIAYVSLISIFSMTQDYRVFLLIKLFTNLSDKITYKEIYFLLLLFDVIGVINNTSNSLARHMEKYLNKYPYNSHTIEKKKEYVINSLSDNEYVKAFSLENEGEVIIPALKNLNMDFKIQDNNVYIKAFYFNGLDNVLDSLRVNSP